MTLRTDFGTRYVLVTLEDVSGYTWLRPSRACTANSIVEELVRSCATFGLPPTWVSDNAPHFRNRVVNKPAKSLGVEHRFPVANSAWTNGTVERMIREVTHGAKAMPNEGRQPLREWVVVLPAVQWALDTASRKRLQATPYHVMMGGGATYGLSCSHSMQTTRVFNSARSTKTGCNNWAFLWWIPKRSSWQGCCNASTPIVVTTVRAAVAARLCPISR